MDAGDRRARRRARLRRGGHPLPGRLTRAVGLMGYTEIAYDVADHVATITLNRPEAANAQNMPLLDDLDECWRRAADDPEVRVIVLRAEGAAFCAGADLHWMQQMATFSDAENLADARQLAQMLKTIYLCSKPVVARVQGDCYAGGVGLVAACDIAVAADHAQFCLSEVKLGLIPATISPYVISAMGQNTARRYFLTAERFGAAEAARMGLVQEAVPLAQLDTVVQKIVDALGNASPNAVREAKRLVREIGGAPLTDALIDDTAARIASIRASDEGREGVRAFLEKRKPNWLV